VSLSPDANDWKLSTVTWIFSLAFAMLGLSAALFGKWLEKVGPRKAMFVSMLCFSGGFFISALGIYLHQIFLIYLGYGFLGGIGLGLGYISPVSTLMKWFPDRPGMATGLAIMGFGGGALIGSPLAVALMDFFKSGTSNGVFETFLCLGGLYLFFMAFGVINIKIPKSALAPVVDLEKKSQVKHFSPEGMSVEKAIRTHQFWLLWIVLCSNVTAGIAIISQASPLIQEMFKGSVSASAASGFVGLLSIFNLFGRFVWSSLSDLMGRKITYSIYFGLGLILYATIPTLGHSQNLGLFILVCCLVISMYGGGFSAIPAYLKDLFGLYNVGAIHGRLLTAWSTAGILGPALITYLKERQLAQGVLLADSYTFTIYMMLIVLFVGFVANLLIQPLSEKQKLKRELKMKRFL
jgi:MFS family permease